MILMKEIMLFSSIGSSSIHHSMPKGAYITDAFLMNGAVYISVLVDDTQPYVTRRFHLTGPFNTMNITQGVRCWHVGTVEIPTPGGASYRYYVIESEN